MALNIGTGLKQWSLDHQAEILTDSDFHNNSDGSLVYEQNLMLVGASDGVTKIPVVVTYIAATDKIYISSMGAPA